MRKLRTITNYQKRKEKIDQINNLIMELASGNFEYRIPPDDDYEDLECIIVGINMLGEELKNSTVSRNYLDSIYKGIVDMCFILDRDEKIKSINSTVTNLLQYEGYHLENQPFRNLLDESGKNISDEKIKRLHEDGFSYSIEKTLVSKNGQLFPVSCSCSVLFDNTGNCIGYLIIAQDLSLRIKYEEDLRKEKERFELALQASNDGIWDWDLENQIYYFSPRWKEMLGYAQDELSNSVESWDRTIFPEDKIIALQLLDDYNNGKAPEFKAIQRYYHKSGTTLYVLSRCISQKDNTGKVVRMIWSHTDITFQKLSEIELKKAKEQAEAANEAKTNFLTNISHEIRTPLNGILGFTECLSETQLSTEQKDFVTKIENSGKTLSQLLKDILDLSKIEIKNLKLDPQQFDFRKEMTQAITPYNFIAKEKNLELKFGFDDSIPYENIVGDSMRINQIVIHLLTNAIKFTQEGSININFKLINDFRLKPDEAYLKGVISDTGEGIPSDKIHSIFENFTQVDGSTTRKYGGSGLGLAIVKQLVTLMDGTIIATSPLPNRKSAKFPGSTFEFLIKIRKAKNGATSVDAPGKQVTGKILFKHPYRILVVDDIDMNQILAKRVLKDMGAEVVVVDNGLKAIEAALSQDFDIILMDVQMPVMNGIEATRKLREQLYGKPILAFSAHVGKEDIENCLNAGMNGYIGKPFTKPEIFEAIANILD